MNPLKPIDHSTLQARLQQAAQWHREGQVQQAAQAYAEVLELNPRDADALHLLGLCHLQAGQVQQAAALFKEALKQRPTDAQIWTHLGVACRHFGNLEEALAAQHKALSLQPQLVDAWVNLGNLRHAQGEYAEALKSHSTALELSAHHVSALVSRAAAHVAMAHWTEAHEDYERALALEPSNADAMFYSGLLHLLHGEAAPGWLRYEWRWQRAAFVQQNPVRFKPALRWNGSTSLMGQRLLILAEQGLGDAIQAVRWIPQLTAQGAQVTLEVASPLYRLFSEMSGMGDLVTKGAELPQTDLHLPMMSLPALLGVGPQGQEHHRSTDASASRPYLRASRERCVQWSQWLGPKRGARVGLVWRAGTNPFGQARHVALDELMPAVVGAFARGQDVELIAVQKEMTQEEMRKWPQLRPTAHLQADMADAAALIMNLDLVISVDTSVAHLAGALGAPVWILLPASPDWRWGLQGEHTVWYPSARLFRQDRPGHWNSVLQALTRVLARALRR